MKTVTFISVIFFFVGLVFGEVINVPGDQATIQAGIDAASDGDTVLVADSTYYENINFRGKAITVASHFILDQDTSHKSKTVINGSQPSHPDSGSAVYFAGGTDTNSVLTGFTITGGSGNIFRPPGYTYDLHYGGGIFVDALDGARIEWNIIENNIANSNFVAGGGGIASGSPGGPGYTIIENNTIRNNELSGTSGLKEGCGIWMGNNGRIVNNMIAANLSHSTNDHSIGAIRFRSGGDVPVSTVYVTGNTIKDNQSISDYSYCTGGGLSSTFTTLIMINNQVENNNLNGKTECAAAGIHVAYLTNKSRIENNIIRANNMNKGTGMDYNGGGIVLWESETSIINNTIIDNYAGVSGGGIYLGGSNPQINNNRIISNSATSGGGIACYYSSDPEIKNNLITYNTAGDDGGGIDFYSNSNPALVNNTIVENKARWGAAIVFNSDCDPVIMNTILYGNSADSSGNQVHFWDDDSDPTFSYCDVEGGKDNFGFYNAGHSYDGTYKNNLDNDPLFVDDDSLFHLSATSPCIDAGNPDSEYNDPEDPNNSGFALWPALGTVRNDMGAIGGALVTVIEDHGEIVHGLPKNFILYQNYPNPFNPTTAISYQLSAVIQVDLSIYNVLGQKVSTLVSGKQPAGNYEVEWDAGDVSSGIYFYTLKTDNWMVQTRKMIVLK